MSSMSVMIVYKKSGYQLELLI